MTLITVVFVAFALLVIFYTNFMTHTLCERKQIVMRAASPVSFGLLMYV